MDAQVVGTIVALSGSARQQVAGETIPLAIDSPIYKGAVLVTGADSRIEVRFSDSTMLSQGQNSEISVDNYVFDDDPASAGSILLNLTEGTLRTITGKIAEENPENFTIKSPLATLGIRGTDLVVKSVDGIDEFFLNEPGLNHFVVITNLKGDKRYLHEPGQSVTFTRDMAEQVETKLDEARIKLLEAVPFTTAQETSQPSREPAEVREDRADDILVESDGETESKEMTPAEIAAALEAGDTSVLENIAETAAGDIEVPAAIAFDGFAPVGMDWHLYRPVYSSFENYSLALELSDELTPESDLLNITPKQTPPPPPEPTPTEPVQPQSEDPVTTADIPTAPLAQPLVEPLAVPGQQPAPSGPQITFLGSSGDDIIIGNEADNVIYGGGGADQQFGAGGNDTFIILGTFEAGAYFGTLLDSIDLSQASSGDLPDNIIGGDADFDTLVIYGDADFTSVQLQSIEGVEIHSEVIFRPDQFDSVEQLVGIGPESHTVIITTPGEVDLSAIAITNIDEIILEKGVTATVDSDTVLPSESGLGVNFIGGSGKLYVNGSLAEFVATYDASIGKNIIIGEAPSAVDDKASTDEDTPVIIDVLGNDTGNDQGDTLSFAGIPTAKNGDVEIIGDQLIYTPDADFNGTDTIFYEIIDAGRQTDTATVSVTVNPIDDLEKVTEITYNDKNGQEQNACVGESGIIGGPIDTQYGTFSITQNGAYSYVPDFKSGSATPINLSSTGFTLLAFDFFDYALLGDGVLNDGYTTNGVFDPSKADGTLAFDEDGVGVASGSPVSSQINHDKDGLSQALAVQFDGPVESATFTVTHLFPDEGPFSSSESGYWEAFDAEGSLIDGGFINENTIDIDSDETGSLSIDVGEDFQTVVFTATPYIDSDNDVTEFADRNDSSDYFVKDIEWDAADTQETITVVAENVGPDDLDLQTTLTLTATGNEETIEGDVFDDVPEAGPAVSSQTSGSDPSPLMAANFADSADQQQEEALTSTLFGDEPEGGEPGSLAMVEPGSEAEPLFGDGETAAGESSAEPLEQPQFEPLVAEHTTMEMKLDLVDGESPEPLVEEPVETDLDPLIVPLAEDIDVA